jgi:mRNA-degrading endonuclease RelE of RelBE toxin-antitoxin system
VPELRLTRRARRDLESLPAPAQDAVLETLALIAADPEGMGKQLLGRLAGLRSTRVGNYRVLYTLEKGGPVVRAVSHRAVAYRLRP